MYPYSNAGLLSKGLSLTKAINWSALLDGTQKTLGIINQAIPVFYQVKPIINNTKTLFKIANVMNDNTSSTKQLPQSTTAGTGNNTTTTENSNNNTTAIKNSPIFYI